MEKEERKSVKRLRGEPRYYFFGAIISLQQVFMTIDATKWPENN